MKAKRREPQPKTTEVIGIPEHSEPAPRFYPEQEISDEIRQQLLNEVKKHRDPMDEDQFVPQAMRLLILFPELRDELDLEPLWPALRDYDRKMAGIADRVSDAGYFSDLMFLYPGRQRELNLDEYWNHFQSRFELFKNDNNWSWYSMHLLDALTVFPEKKAEIDLETYKDKIVQALGNYRSQAKRSDIGWINVLEHAARIHQLYPDMRGKLGIDMEVRENAQDWLDAYAEDESWDGYLGVAADLYMATSTEMKILDDGTLVINRVPPPTAIAEGQPLPERPQV